MEDGKFKELAEHVRAETSQRGGPGMILLVIDRVQDEEREGQQGRSFEMHVAVTVDHDIRDALPRLLRDLAQKIETEQRAEHIAELLQRLTADNDKEH